MKILSLALAATTLAGVMATSAHAQSYAQTAESPLTLGVGMSYAPDYSGSEDYEAKVLPLVNAKTEITPGNTLYVKGVSAGLDHMIDERLTVGLMAQYRFERDSSDNAVLSGMKDIDWGIDMGPKVRFQATPQLGFEANMLFDVTDTHDGFTGRVGTDYAMPLSEVTLLTLAGGVNYGSDDYVTTYYGVPAAQAAAGRPAYSPDAGITHLDVNVGVRHSLTPNWSLMGGVGADYLVGDVADSPLVKQELQPKVMLGLAYSF